MDATLKGLLGLLGGKDAEARCAALVVLTHLEVDEDRVVKKAGEALSSTNVLVRDFALGYFERVRPRQGLAHMLPLLEAAEDPVRQRAVAVLAHYGASAVTAARKLPKEAPRRRLSAVIDLCARVRSAAALDFLYDRLASDDFDANRAACDAVLAVLPAADAKSRADLFARTERLAAGARGRRTALVASAKLFGGLADASARKQLFPMLAAREPTVVRAHALAALANCLRGARLSKAEVDALLPLLAEEDEAAFLRPAVRLLEGQDLDRSYLGQLNKLAESPQPLVKRFAVQKLGSFDSAPVVKTLIGYLTDDSYARRNQATASLKTMPAARAALMKELLGCEDERKAWTLVEILLAQDRNWKRDVLEQLWKRLERALDTREDRLWAAYLNFLNELDPTKLHERLRGRADRLRKGRRFPAVARTLSLLKDTPAFDDETRFALAIAELKSHKHAFGAVARRQDPALDMLRRLADSAFPVVERLRRERALAPDDLYYVAFNLAEGHGQEKELARDLLAHIVTKHGRTKVGKAAKSKLSLLPPA